MTTPKHWALVMIEAELRWRRAACWKANDRERQDAYCRSLTAGCRALDAVAREARAL